MSKRNWVIAGAVLLLAAVGLYIAFRPPPHTDRPIVAITQIATHPALDEVREGIIAGLKKRGYTDGKDIEILFKNANGDASLALPIAQDFVRRSPAVIVPISTPSTLAVLKSTKTLPVVFSGVADPKGAGVVKDFEHPGGNVTGVCDSWPFEEQVKVFQSAFPKAKRIGMLYTKGDDVSRIGVEAMTGLAPKLGFELKLSPVSSAQDIYPTAVARFKDVDTIFTGIDHLILENMEGLAKAANEANKPLFGGETGSVEKGAVLAYSINMTEFGDITADMVVEVLKGRKPADMPVRVVSSCQLYVNVRAAKRFGLSIEDLKAKGAKLVEGD